MSALPSRPGNDLTTNSHDDDVRRGSLSKIMSSIPGLSGAMEGVSDEDAGSKLKRMIFIMDSMDNAELDSDGLIFVSVFGAFCKSENSTAFPNLEHA